MKRLMPSTLITFLQQNPNCAKADLFQIDLPNGNWMFVTEGQFDITIPTATPGNAWGVAVTFLASEFGKWSRGPITSEAGFNLSANSMTLTCVPSAATLYYGSSSPLLSCAYQGLFDAAQVTVWTAYFPTNSYGTVTPGIEKKFFGYIEKINKINRVMVEFEVQDPFYLFNEKVPKRLIQSPCPWSFCDGNCGLTASNFTVSFTAKTGSTQSILTPTTAFARSAGYFTQGVVTCLTGQNAGLSATVKLHDTSGNLELVYPFILPVAAGDTYSVVKGCDKTTAMCAASIEASGTSINNLNNYGGAIAVPVPVSGV